MAIDCGLILRRVDGAVFRKIAGEGLIVPVKGRLADLQCVYGVEGVGEWIWDRIDGHAPVAGIATSVAKEFEVDQDVALADCQAFCSELIESGLVQAVEVTGG